MINYTALSLLSDVVINFLRRGLSSKTSEVMKLCGYKPFADLVNNNQRYILGPNSLEFKGLSIDQYKRSTDMGSGNVDITLELNNGDGYKYKPLDTIRGRAHLKVNKEISVKEVIVQFEGTSTSQFKVRERRGTSNGTQSVTKRESHILVLDHVVIFPPPNVRNVSDGKGFTLTPGEYSYDFGFKIPLENTCAYTGAASRGTGFTDGFRRQNGHGLTRLPPSMGIDSIGYVNYRIEVVVKRTSWIKPNPKRDRNPLVTSFDPLDDLINYSKRFLLRDSFVFQGKIPKRIALTEKPTGPESYEIPQKESTRKKSSHFIKSLFGSKEPAPEFAQELDIPLTFEARIKSSFLTIGQPLDLGIYLTSKYGPGMYKGIDGLSSGLGQFFLVDIGVDLIGIFNAAADGRVKQEERTYTLSKKRDLLMMLDLANLEPNPLHGINSGSNPYRLEIPKELYADAIVLDVIKPTFDTCNIKLYYRMNIYAKFKAEEKSWSNKNIDLLTPVTVLAGFPAPEEYMQMKRIPPDLAQRFLSNYPPEAFRKPEDFTPLYDDRAVPPVQADQIPETPDPVDEKQNLKETEEKMGLVALQ